VAMLLTIVGPPVLDVFSPFTFDDKKDKSKRTAATKKFDEHYIPMGLIRRLYHFSNSTYNVSSDTNK